MKIGEHELSPLAQSVAASLLSLDSDRTKAWEAYEAEDRAHKATRALLREEELARQSETKRADEAERAIVALAKAGRDANLIREHGMTLDTATRCGVQAVYLSRGYVAAINAVWQRFTDALADPLVVGLMAPNSLETQAPEVPQ